MWRGKSAWWRFGLVSFSLWAANLVVGVAAFFSLPRFNPAGAQSGCYIRNAMLVFVECAKDLPGGRLIEVGLNLSWWLIGNLLAPGYPWVPSQHPQKLLLIALLVVGATTLVGAVGFVTASIWKGIRRTLP
jgi:hypothetical protein